MQQPTDFYPLMKVTLDCEHGVVVEQFFTDAGTGTNLYGVICWDTEKESDFEDWRGLWGTFVALGGREIDPSHPFQYINDDGTYKKLTRVGADADL